MVLSINYYLKKREQKILPISDGLNENDKKNIKFIDYNDIESSEKILNKFKNKKYLV